jgi:Fe-S-cluster containining protein
MVETPVSESTILQEYPRLSLEDRFTFRCGADLECFTHCCCDVSIVLTPYDVLRMTRALRLDSSEFLERHTLLPIAKDQRIPVVLLKMDPETKRCPFVGDQGCQIYHARPWACRMYPLGIAEPRTPTAEDRPFHFLLSDQTCLGHTGGRSQTVREWRAEQGIDDYDMHGTSFKDLMLHEFWDRQIPLSPEKLEIYYTACYDLDRFRRFVFDTTLLATFEVDTERVEVMREDDEELLEFAMQWLRFCLCGDRTMRLKPSVLEARSRMTSARETAALAATDRVPRPGEEGVRP